MAKTNRLHRSELAVPGSNLRMIEKAPNAGADCVFIDLEDAVAPDDKVQARKNAIEAIKAIPADKPSMLSIRLNALVIITIQINVKGIATIGGMILSLIPNPTIPKAMTN